MQKIKPRYIVNMGNINIVIFEYFGDIFTNVAVHSPLTDDAVRAVECAFASGVITVLMTSI